MGSCASHQSRRHFRASLSHFGLNEDFSSALERVKTAKPSNDQLLQLYALYKQATEGKNAKPKPGLFDMVGKAKWDAWNQLGDISHDEAKKKYIELVNGLVGSTESKHESNNSNKPGQASDYSTLNVQFQNGVQVITMNRPDRMNALNLDMYKEIQQALNAASENESIKVSVLTGAGVYFCSGNDLSNFTQIPPEGPKKLAADARKVLEQYVRTFIDHPKILIASVNGPAIGIAVTILGLFDFVYASHKATFQTPFTSLGQSPEACSSVIFPRLIGPLRANEMLIAGKKFTAEDLHPGLVTGLFGEHELSSKVIEQATKIASLPPQVSLLFFYLFSLSLSKSP